MPDGATPCPMVQHDARWCNAMHHQRAHTVRLRRGARRCTARSPRSCLRTVQTRARRLCALACACACACACARAGVCAPARLTRSESLSVSIRLCNDMCAVYLVCRMPHARCVVYAGEADAQRLLRYLGQAVSHAEGLFGAGLSGDSARTLASTSRAACSHTAVCVVWFCTDRPVAIMGGGRRMRALPVRKPARDICTAICTASKARFEHAERVELATQSWRLVYATSHAT